MKKKHLFLIMMILLSSTNAFSYDFSATVPSGQTLYFDTVAGTAWVTYPNHYVYGNGENDYYYAFSKPTGNLIIPDTIVNDGTTYDVVGIGDYAFFLCSGLTSVTIGNKVSTIGDAAFLRCTSMTSVVVAESVTNIGWSPFAECTGLLSPVMNSRLFIYMPTTYAGSYEIPYGIEEISATAFQECTSITSILIPNTVRIIGQQAFLGCEHLTSLSIPESVDTIGPYAFTDSGIGTITLYGAPPVFSVYTNITDISPNTLIIVPCGMSTLYSNTPGWNHFNNIISFFPYTFQLDQTGGGSVTVLTQPSCSSPAMFRADGNDTVSFSHWNDGNTDNPRTITVTQDTSLIAIFVSTSTIDSNLHSDTVFVIDTIYLSVHDTVYVPEPYEVRDTTYIIQIETLTDTLWLTRYDTLFIPEPYAVHDTTYIIQIDTLYVPSYDTVYVPEPYEVHDTTYIIQIDTLTDTLLVTQYDTLWLHDTIYIHDTIVVGVDGVEALNAKVYVSDGQIVVEGAEGNDVWLYDVTGRLVTHSSASRGAAVGSHGLGNLPGGYGIMRFDVPSSGTYMIKIGNHPARKVVVVR